MNNWKCLKSVQTMSSTTVVSTNVSLSAELMRNTIKSNSKTDKQKVLESQ